MYVQLLLLLLFIFLFRFKLEMHDLELSASKLMSNALDSIKEIEDGNKVLMMFEKYFGKEVC